MRLLLGQVRKPQREKALMGQVREPQREKALRAPLNTLLGDGQAVHNLHICSRTGVLLHMGF